MISERDYNNILATARKEGRIEERSVMAKKLKDLGVSDVVIAESSGLTIEQIKEL